MKVQSNKYQKSLDFFYIDHPNDVSLLGKSWDFFPIGKKFSFLTLKGEKVPVTYQGKLHGTSNLSVFHDQEGKRHIGLIFELPYNYVKKIPTYMTTTEHVIPKAYEVLFDLQYPDQPTSRYNQDLRSRVALYELEAKKSRQEHHLETTQIPNGGWGSGEDYYN